MSVELNHDELLAKGLPLYFERAREITTRCNEAIVQKEQQKQKQYDVMMALYFAHLRGRRHG